MHFFLYENVVLSGRVVIHYSVANNVFFSFLILLSDRKPTLAFQNSYLPFSKNESSKLYKPKICSLKILYGTKKKIIKFKEINNLNSKHINIYYIQISNL